MSDSQPLFVRLPAPAAEQLERITSSSGASKREVVTRLILGDEMTVGQHQFLPAQEPAVLTSTQAAELLQVEEALVVQLAEAGELPGRCLAGQWRFSRPALLDWLGGRVTESSPRKSALDD